MTEKKPRVSIGLPVYNGENYLEAALNAILAQTYTDLELIISDNASSDNTQDICMFYSKKDERIRYYRNEINIGLNPNFNHVFEFATGEYFAFAAHDDRMSPEYIARCVEVLDNDPTIVLCHSRVMIVDDQGNHKSQIDKVLLFPNEASALPHKRFKDLIMINHLGVDCYGLLRAKLITDRPIFDSHYGADRNFLAELSLRGKFHHIPQVLFFWRDEQEKYWQFNSWFNRLLSWKSWAERLDTSKPEKIPVPRWSNLRGYIHSVRRVKLSKMERLRCYLVIVEWIMMHVRGLGKDLIVAIVIMICARTGLNERFLAART